MASVAVKSIYIILIAKQRNTRITVTLSLGITVTLGLGISVTLGLGISVALGPGVTVTLGLGISVALGPVAGSGGFEVNLQLWGLKQRALCSRHRGFVAQNIGALWLK